MRYRGWKVSTCGGQTVHGAASAILRDRVTARWEPEPMTRPVGRLATFVRRGALTLAVVCALTGVALALLYALPELQPISTFTAVASALVPYGVLAWAIAVLCVLLTARRWQRLWLLPLLTMLVVQSIWARPYWPVAPHGSPARGARLEVFSANLLHGSADPSATAAALIASDADVAILIEVNDAFLTAPPLATALERYPHRVGRSMPGMAGDPSTMVVLSQRPLTLVSRLPGRLDQYLVRVEGAPGQPPWVVAAVHSINMLHGARSWDAEAQALSTALNRFQNGPLVVVGDFNATPDQVPIRRLVDAGLRLGATDAGAGWQPTFDAGLPGVPAFVAIDHALTSNDVRVTRYATIPLPGSDHRALSLTVRRI